MHEGYQVSSLLSQEMCGAYLRATQRLRHLRDRWSRLLKVSSHRLQRIVTLLLVFNLVPSLVPEFGRPVVRASRPLPEVVRPLCNALVQRVVGRSHQTGFQAFGRCR